MAFRPKTFKFLCWGIAGLCALSVLSVNFSNITNIPQKGAGKIFQSPVNKLRNDLFDEKVNLDSASNQVEFFSRNLFTVGGQHKPTDDQLQPKLDTISENLSTIVAPFLKRRLYHEPASANFLSKQLTRSSEIIREAQRVHFNVLEDALKKYKYAMLFDTDDVENIGDSAITVGEIYLLQRMNIKVIYYCSFSSCNNDNLVKAQTLAYRYTPDELVILSQGGGTMILYHNHDKIRYRLLEFFPDYQILIFPQRIGIENEENVPIEKTVVYFCCSTNLSIVLRDHKSYNIAREMFNGSSRLLMAPDMAFQIGQVQRSISPVFDILWIKRTDKESPGYIANIQVPGHLRVHISDWLKWSTPKGGNNLENAFSTAANGFTFLQRGRVIITDRLHGHILSTLMDIPHVLIDNTAKKLSSYHNTWTKSLENTVLTDNPNVALELAIGLLKKYNNTLPPIVPFLDLDENFKPVVHNKPLIGYP